MDNISTLLLNRLKFKDTRFSIWRRAVQCGLSVLLAMVLPSAAFAEAAIQRQELAAVLRQLDGLERLERLVRHSEANTLVIAGERYHFDYPRLLSDLVQVRTGIQTWLAPSRAQPRDLTELSGDYRREVQQP